MQTNNRLIRIMSLGAVAVAFGACSGSGEDESEDGDSASASGGAGSGGVASTAGGAATSGGGPANVGGGAGGGNTATGGKPNGVGGTTNASGGADAAGGADNVGGSDAEGAGGSTNGSGGAFTGTCTASLPAGRNVTGSGPHEVIVETNSDAGINEGTIFRPADLGGAEKYPIFVWGEGGCSQDGYSNASAMAEIASYGYFVVADGTPDGDGRRSTNGDGGPLLAYVDWAIAENEKPCSAYYQSIDATKVAANGFSCGGLMAAGTAEDQRMTTWGHTSSGLFSDDQAFYQAVHTPVLILTGTNDDLAYENGLNDYEGIVSAGNVPIMFLAKAGAGHGGDLFQSGGGEFTEVILAWLNWWLKEDETTAGKGALVGASCPYCTDASWNVMSNNVP
jgi:hypothetical protein